MCLRAHLHTATATTLRHRCIIAPKSNLLFWCCTVTPSDCDVVAMMLGNRFVSDWERCRSDIAVARCKWALNACIVLGDGRFTADVYVTITVTCHPYLSQPWVYSGYITIIVDQSVTKYNPRLSCDSQDHHIEIVPTGMNTSECFCEWSASGNILLLVTASGLKA